ncbi:unnamed protein product [Moneuplotes crassus]|uniref:Uncharacterized protein n=1 Tax=Euplotes crassus TaxID=5936 RepID=A0AAD1XBL3_EUPCR|nr:unnamed protein product [Moneuplotes crassus]
MEIAQKFALKVQVGDKIKRLVSKEYTSLLDLKLTIEKSFPELKGNNFEMSYLDSLNEGEVTTYLCEDSDLKNLIFQSQAFPDKTIKILVEKELLLYTFSQDAPYFNVFDDKKQTKAKERYEEVEDLFSSGSKVDILNMHKELIPEEESEHSSFNQKRPEIETTSESEVCLTPSEQEVALEPSQSFLKQVLQKRLMQLQADLSQVVLENFCGDQAEEPLESLHKSCRNKKSSTLLEMIIREIENDEKPDYEFGYLMQKMEADEEEILEDNKKNENELSKKSNEEENNEIEISERISKEFMHLAHSNLFEIPEKNKGEAKIFLGREKQLNKRYSSRNVKGQVRLEQHNSENSEESTDQPLSSDFKILLVKGGLIRDCDKNCFLVFTMLNRSSRDITLNSAIVIDKSFALEIEDCKLDTKVQGNDGVATVSIPMKTPPLSGTYAVYLALFCEEVGMIRDQEEFLILCK